MIESEKLLINEYSNSFYGFYTKRKAFLSYLSYSFYFLLLYLDNKKKLNDKERIQNELKQK